MHVRKPLVGILSAALLVAAIPAVVAAQDEFEVTPEGAVWSLTSVGGQEVPAEVDASLYMEDGEANGNGGCNSFSGTYTLDGASIAFDENMAVTMAFCEGPAQVVEGAYLPALATAASWTIDGNVLSMADEAGAVTLTFVEPTVDLTETDIVALLEELTRLDDRISKTRQDVRSLNIPKIQSHTDKNTEGLAALALTVQNQNVPGLRERVIANEEVLSELTDRFVNVRARVRDLEARVEKIEEQLGLEINPQ